MTLPPITGDLRSARKSVPISHTPKIASSGIVIEEDRVEPPEALDGKSLTMALAEGNVLPEINPETADDKDDGDEVLQPAEKIKTEL